MITGTKRATEKEYRGLDQLSSSDLRLFTQDKRAFFKKKVLKEGETDDEEYNRSSMIGSLVHCLLLEPETFDHKYMMSICQKIPTELMLTFVQALHKHTILSIVDGEVTEEFSSLAQKAYNDSEFKITLPAVMNKFTGKDPEDYYKELRESHSKGLEVVCIDDITIANSIVTTIRQDENVGYIFSMESSDDIDIYNEIKIEDIDLYGTKMKMMGDKVVVNHTEKTIQLYDLKVIWDPIRFYRDYYLKKFGYLQGGIYYELIFRWAALNELTGYMILPPIFVVADSSNFYCPLLYKMTREDLQDAVDGFTIGDRTYIGIKSILEEIKWSQETGNWRTNKEAVDNNGFLQLKY